MTWMDCEASLLAVDGIRTAMSPVLPCGNAVCPVCWQTVPVTKDGATLRFTIHARQLPVNPQEDGFWVPETRRSAA